MKIVVQEESINLRLDFFLFRFVEEIPSRSFAQKFVNQGKVLVNNKTKKGSYKLQIFDEVFVDLDFLNDSAKTPVLAEEIPLNILYEDSDILVLVKPSGMVVHPGAGVRSGTLVNALLAHCQNKLPSLDGDTDRPGIVHRLDKDTSGVMVVAKTLSALKHLMQQFAAHSHKRIYLVLTYQCFHVDHRSRIKLEHTGKKWHLETGYGRDPRNRIRQIVLEKGEGKRAALSFFPVWINELENCQLLECQLETGRTHQIRAQMAYLGFPLMGDLLYGSLPTKNKMMKVQVKWIKEHVPRQMLHAKILGFQHPKTGKNMEFECSPPEDFRTVASHFEPK